MCVFRKNVANKKRDFLKNQRKIHDFSIIFFCHKKIEKSENFRLSKKWLKTVQRHAGCSIQLSTALLPHINHSKWSCFQIWTNSVVESYFWVPAVAKIIFLNISRVKTFSFFSEESSPIRRAKNVTCMPRSQKSKKKSFGRGAQ